MATILTEEIVTKPISLKIGCNFDLDLLSGLHALNEKYPDLPWQIKELYGSLANVNPIGTARPGFRLQGGDEQFLAKYVAHAAFAGMGINYTLNVSMVDPRELKAKEAEIVTFLDFLSKIGIVRVTVAHPLVAKIVNDNSTLPIELSTIMQIRHPRQLAQLKERIPAIQKLCLDVFANRDAMLLFSLHEEATELGITLEAIANEFCVYECPDRNQCYDLHALNLTQDETKLFGHYPMGNCIRERLINPIEWLYARFILPQWMEHYYSKFNISSFKITGRTHPTSYILKVAEAYMSGYYGGNLLELWADVANIGRLEAEYQSPRIVLTVSKMRQDFLDFYFNPRPYSKRMESAYLTEVLRACRDAVS